MAASQVPHLGQGLGVGALVALALGLRRLQALHLLLRMEGK